MEMEPLHWPDFRTRANAWQRFTRDVPFIGLDSRTRRYLFRVLKNRSPSVLALWENDSETLSCLLVTSQLIKENFGWPNTFFIPEDPCEILLWEYSIDLSFAETIRDLKKVFSLLDFVFEGLEKLTYGKFIERIKENMKCDIG